MVIADVLRGQYYFSLTIHFREILNSFREGEREVICVEK